MKYIASLLLALALAACGAGNNAAETNGNQAAANTAGNVEAEFVFSGGDTDSPQNVVFAMETARRADDDARFKGLLCKDDLAKMKEGDRAPTPKNTFKVGKAKIDGDSATVEVIYTKPDGETGPPLKWYCIKEDGEWKLQFGKSFMEMLKGGSDD